MPLKLIAFFILSQLILLGAANFGSAAETQHMATFREVAVTTSDTHLLVFATLNYSFTPEMTAILHSGIALKFSFFIELYKTAKNWPDEQIVIRTFQHILSYNMLKENYRITLEEDNNIVLPFKSMALAQNVLNELNGIKVINLKQLIPDNHYKLKIRAELYQKTLPLSLQNTLPFLSWWDVATDWHSIEFQY